MFFFLTSTLQASKIPILALNHYQASLLHKIWLFSHCEQIDKIAHTWPPPIFSFISIYLGLHGLTPGPWRLAFCITHYSSCITHFTLLLALGPRRLTLGVWQVALGASRLAPHITFTYYAFCISHFVLCILYYAFCISHFVLCIYASHISSYAFRVYALCVTYFTFPLGDWAWG